MTLSVVPYSPTYDFAGDLAAANMVNAAALQAELARISSWGADLSSMLGELVRDDDSFQDETVRVRHLHPELWSYILTQIEGNLQTQALNWLEPALAASTANVVTLADIATIDGVSLITGNRVLLTAQTNPVLNGLWVVGAIGDAGNPGGLWTRPTDFTGVISGGIGIMVRSGTVNGSTAYALAAGSAQAVTVGTSSITFINVVGPYPVPVNRGGTGSTTAAGARTALGMPGKFTANITGDGIAATFFLAHSLATRDVVVSVRATTGPMEQIGVEVRCSSTAQIEIAFNTPPGVGEVLAVTVIG